MIAKLLILGVALCAGVAASLRVWRLRHRPQPLDPLPGPVPGPGDAGPLP